MHRVDVFDHDGLVLLVRRIICLEILTLRNLLYVKTACSLDITGLSNQALVGVAIRFLFALLDALPIGMVLGCSGTATVRTAG